MLGKARPKERTTTIAATHSDTPSARSPELALNAITHDPGPIMSSFGDFTSQIGPGPIGRDEIGTGQAAAAELDPIVKCSASSPELNLGQPALVTASCEPGCTGTVLIARE